MGLLEDIGNWIGEQITKITDWIRSFITGAIDQITIWVRALMMGMRRWLAEFMSTTHGFWIAIAVVIVASVGVLYIGSTEWFLAIAEYVKGWIEAAKETMGLVLEWVGFTYFNTIHELALIFVEQYAAWWEPIYQAFASMSQELGVGIGTINTLSRAGQQLAALGFMVAGVPAGAAWIISESDRATWLESVEERWKKYAVNPYAVFTDIDTELVFPAVEMLGEEFQKRWQILQDVQGEVARQFGLWEAMHDTIDDLLESLPEEFAIVRDGIWNDMSTEFERIMDEQVSPFMAKLDAAVLVVNQAIVRQEIKVRAMVEQVRLPGNYLASVFFLPEPLRSEQFRILAYVFGRAYEGEIEASRPIVRQTVTIDRLSSIAALTVTPEIAPVRDTPILSPPDPTPRSQIPGWYVGAY